MTKHVAADAQYGLAKILRPFNGFEAVYAGQSGVIPIMFTEQGTILDPEAGTTGTSNRLVKGQNVPMGARLLLWLPIIGFSGEHTTVYRWIVIWRLRSTRNFRTSRGPFHYPKQGAGVDSTLPAIGTAQPDTGPRSLRPACHHTVVYNQTEPAGTFDSVAQTVRMELIDIRADVPASGGTPDLPFISAGVRGFYQQGLQDPAGPLETSPGMYSAGTPQYVLLELQAAGDEFLLGCRKTDATVWNFDVADFAFSDLFGTGSGLPGPAPGAATFPDIGVYLMMGTST